MSATHSCPRCGAPFSGATLEGLCPNCVGRLVLMPEPLPGRPAGGGTATGSKVRYFGDYELLEEIARGGMGVVYKARQMSLNRIVAVKMILAGQLASETDVQRFRAEAEAAANLQHPNIVAIHEIGEHDGQHYFSMDYVEGKNLAHRSDDLRLTIDDFKRAARYLKTIAEAIHYAHQRGTLHRDLKPSNILIDQNDQPRITDFGLAKRVKHDSDLTESGQVLGTPNFMPPEQASGKRAEVGPQSDVYSLGAILYFLLTGKPPFAAETFHETVTQVLTREPAPPHKSVPSVPADLETICLKCLEKEPKRRYSSAQELADELGRFLRDEPILARPIGHLERGWRWCKRHPAAVGASLALAIALPVVLELLSFAKAAWTRAPIQSASRPSIKYEGPVATVIALDGDNFDNQTRLGPGEGVAVDPMNNHIWCPIMSNSTVVVRDGTTGAVITNIVLADCPGVAVFDPTNRRVWVTAQCGILPKLGTNASLPSSDAVWPILADTYQVIERIPCGGLNSTPELVNPRTGRFYHSCNPSHESVEACQRINLLSSTLPQKMSYGVPKGVFVESNLLYAATDVPGGSNMLQIIDGEPDPEKVLTSIALPFGVAGYIGVDPRRQRIYVGDARSNRILVCDALDGRALETIRLGAGHEISQVANVVCDSQRNRVYAVARGAAKEGGQYYLYSIQGAKQRSVALEGGPGGPVVNPALNKVYVWVKPSH